MKTMRILVINGHPAAESLSKVLTRVYIKSAESAGHEIRLMDLHDMDFDADHGYGGYKMTKPLEPALETFLQNMAWAEHIVMATPMWWGGIPARLKGLFDRSLLPGRAFDPRTIIRGAPKPMFTGKTARVMVTSDTPSWYMRLAYHSALFHQIRKQIFLFIGVKPTRFTHFSHGSHPTSEQVKALINRVEKLGHTAT